MPPELDFYSHVDRVLETDCDRLKKWSQSAVTECLANPGPGTCDLPALDTVEISIVSDETIAEVHDQFMNDPSATDVITFQHGELLISIDTAEATVTELDHSPIEELFLYVVHGLLHLNGHLDKEETDRIEMHRIQNRIWASVLSLDG